MITIIPLAGASQRFRSAGYTQHKALLPMPDGDSLLDYVINSIMPDDLITVALRSDMKELSRAIRQSNKEGKWRAIWLDTPTHGPLDTVLKASKWLHNTEELLINYCDCFMQSSAWPFIEHMRVSDKPAGMVGFESTNDRFTYYGPLAEGGIFYFKNASKFLQYTHSFYSPYKDVGIPSVVRQSRDFTVWNGSREYVDLGVPADYEMYMKQQDAP